MLLCQILTTVKDEAQAIEISLWSKVVMTDEDCGSVMHNMPRSVRNVIFTGEHTGVPELTRQTPTLILHNDGMCTFPEDVTVIFRTLALDICGDTKELIPITAKRKFQVFLEYVDLQFCDRAWTVEKSPVWCTVMETLRRTIAAYRLTAVT